MPQSAGMPVFVTNEPRGNSNALNLTAGTYQILTGEGVVGVLSVITAASGGNWIINDSVGSAAAATQIYNQAYGSVSAGSFTNIGFPVKTGIFLTVPTGGVAALSWSSVI